MSRPFQIVDDKVGETHFFLSKIDETCDKYQLFEARYYLSAFLASSRSITFSIQAALSGIPNFEPWYLQHQNSLKENKLARYFLLARNSSQKVGYYPIAGGSSYKVKDGKGRMAYYFDDLSTELGDYIPEEDVYTACTAYFQMLLELVIDCYKSFGTTIDPMLHYSYHNFMTMGAKVEDWEEEFGFPRGYTDFPGAAVEERVKALERYSRYQTIDPITFKYLGKDRFGMPFS